MSHKHAQSTLLGNFRGVYGGTYSVPFFLFGKYYSTLGSQAVRRCLCFG